MTTNTDAPCLPDDLNPEVVKATAKFIGQLTGLVPPPHNAFPPEWHGYLRTFTKRLSEIASENAAPSVQADAVRVDAYPESNAEVIEKALYCNQHGDTESVENWLTLLRDRLAARSGDDAVQADFKLPKLTEGEEFICDSGCGTVEPEQYDFEYSREEFPDGRVVSKTEKAWRSPCCKACVLVYSNLADAFTPIEDYVAPASSTGDQA